MSLKLYKKIDEKLHYWESWEDQDGKSATIHWGIVGERGNDKIIKSDFFNNYKKKVQKEIEALKGYFEFESQYTLLIEYSVEGMGSDKDLDKRHALEDRMQETLGWTGLGHCDGGSIGSGTMEICCFVVDFELAKRVIEADLKNTEFSDFTRIYDENVER